MSPTFLAGSHPTPFQVGRIADNLSDMCPKGLISFSSPYWILFRILRDDIFIEGMHQEYLNYALKCNKIVFHD